MVKDAIGSKRVTRHDVHVRFGDPAYAALADFSARSGLALNGSVRMLVERGLAVEDGTPLLDHGPDLARHLKSLADTALAVLVTVEQNQLLLVSMLPAGQELLESLAEAAATNARQRLISLDVLLARESE